MTDHELTDDERRALAAYTDVLAVEWDEQAGVARIVTLSDVYVAVPSEGMHLCPDREYHDVELCKHLYALETVRGRIDAPEGWLVVEDLNERTDPEFDVSTDLPDFAEFEVATDGGQVVPPGQDKWTVWDPERENAHHFDTRGEAEERVEAAKEEFGVDAELYPPGEPPAVEPTDPNETSTDGGEAVEATPDPDPAPDANHEPEVLSPDEVERYAADLDDREVGQDPLKWMPGEFVDTIEGTEAINRKGFEVLRFFYGVDLDMEMEVDPAENDMTHCRYKCVATMDGDSIEAWGTSHVDRGDDPWLLVEMAATRARKRALSIATGAGAVAVAELRNEVGQ